MLTAAPGPRDAGGYSLLPLPTKPGSGEFRGIGLLPQKPKRALFDFVSEAGLAASSGVGSISERFVAHEPFVYAGKASFVEPAP